MSDQVIPWTISAASIREAAVAAGRLVTPDMLATMMSQQLRHMEHYCDPLEQKPDSLQIPFDPDMAGQWDKREVHEAFRRTMGWCAEEIFEAVGLFKGKPWKQNFSAPDRAKVLDEIGDAMHFFLEACLVLGLSPEDLFRAYFKTSDKNVARQNGNY